MAPAKKAPADVKEDFLKIRASVAQLGRWREAFELAKRRDDTVEDFSTWVRQVMNRAAAEEEKRAKKGGGR